jgi:hypothetical protein
MAYRYEGIGRSLSTENSPHNTRKPANLSRQIPFPPLHPPALESAKTDSFSPGPDDYLKAAGVASLLLGINRRRILRHQRKSHFL